MNSDYHIEELRKSITELENSVNELRQSGNTRIAAIGVAGILIGSILSGGANYIIQIEEQNFLTEKQKNI